MTSAVTHSVERQALGVAIDGLLREIKKSDDVTAFYIRGVNFVEKFLGNEKNKDTFEMLRKKIRDPEERWVKQITNILRNGDSHYIKNLALNLGYEALLNGTRVIRENREKYACGIPSIIVFDPTSACNQHCKGCWSGSYGHKNNLSLADMDKIVREGNELGVHLFMLTGGEPLVRKKDIVRLAEEHKDSMFVIFTNSTLIDRELCEKVVRLGNISFLCSIEGSVETNDGRRGDGHFQSAMRAMDLLREHGIVFGTSMCYTRNNISEITSDDFLRFLSSKGASYGFYFHYMPIGRDADINLLPTPEQRRQMIDRIHYLRSEECDIEFFPMDFQNDGKYVGGCIAGGRNYMHINAHGDGEPCVFVHYSSTNIRENTILEMLQSPLFMEYHKAQPFNQNHLRPCAFLENPEALRHMVHKSGSWCTNEAGEETVDELCDRCIDYAAQWAPVADKVWLKEDNLTPSYQYYSKKKLEDLGMI